MCISLICHKAFPSVIIVAILPPSFRYEVNHVSYVAIFVSSFQSSEVTVQAGEEVFQVIWIHQLIPVMDCLLHPSDYPVTDVHPVHLKVVPKETASLGEMLALEFSWV